MTLQADVNRINEGDAVTAEFRHGHEHYEITGTVTRDFGDLRLGPFTLSYEDMMGQYPNANLLRVVAHTPKPAPLYANRPDIKAPRDLDVVTRPSHRQPYTYWAEEGAWRGHGGMYWSTEGLLEVGPLTLVGAAIP